ncbi:hypothetical protein JHK86_055601 [Glycine max]|nr:hypothetical protein JHK86_055601 [Glycine max]
MFLLGSFSPPQPSHTLVQEIIGKTPQMLVNDLMCNVLPIALKERNDCEELAITTLVSGNLEELNAHETVSEERVSKILDVHVHIETYVPPTFGIWGNGVHLAVVGYGRNVAAAKYSDWVSWKFCLQWRIRKPLEKLRAPSVRELLLSNDGDHILEGCVANFFVICCKERNSNDEKALCDYGKKYSFQVQTAPISDGVLPRTIRQLVLDDLSDLVEIIHKVVKLMDNLQSRGALRVSRKSRKVKKNIPEGTESRDKLDGDHSCIQNETGISTVNQSAENQPLQEGLPNANSIGEDVIPDDNEHENHVEEVGNSQVGLEPMGATNSEHVNEDMLDGTNDFSEDEQLHAYNAYNEDIDKLDDVIKGFAPTSGSNNDKDDDNGEQLMEDESQIALRRRKKLVLDGDLERQIKDLHEK